MTPRVRQAVLCLLKGMSNVEIAEQMGLHKTTVDSYIQRAARYYGVYERYALNHVRVAVAAVLVGDCRCSICTSGQQPPSIAGLS